MSACRKVPFFTSARFYASTISAAVLNLRPFGLSLRSVCGPAMNCHGCPWSLGACPVGVMTYGSAIHAFPAMVVGAVLAVGILAGRLVCSFACPFGLVQDLLHRIPGPKLRLWRGLEWGRYLALGLLVVALPWIFGVGVGGFLGIAKPVVNKSGEDVTVAVSVTNHGDAPVSDPTVEIVYRAHADRTELPERVSTVHSGVIIAPGATVELPAVTLPNRLADADLEVRSPQSAVEQSFGTLTYYCKLCPVGTLEATVPALAGSGGGLHGYSGDLWLRLGVAAAFLVAMWLFSRPFCRTFCPLGAIYGLTSRAAVARIEVDAAACTMCGSCAKVCPMELDLPRQIGGHGCIACGDCMKACPQHGIARKFGFR